MGTLPIRMLSAVGRKWHRTRQSWASNGDPDYLARPQGSSGLEPRRIQLLKALVGSARYVRVGKISLSTSWAIYFCQGQNTDVHRGQAGNINEGSGQVQVSRKGRGL